MLDLLFFIALSLLFTHELDAIRRHEWRLFIGLNRLDDETAHRVFTAVHVPLFALFLWLAAHPAEGVRLWFQILVDAFLIVHLGLHWLFRRHPAYEFNNAFSGAIIGGMALFGLLHLSLLLR